MCVVGIIRDFLAGRPQAVTRDLAAAARAPQFAVAVDPGTLYGVQTLDEAIQWWAGSGRITRREAMSVPAVKRARDMIAGVLGATPLRLLDPDRRPVADGWDLLDQPEADRPALVTWTNVADDLLFSARSFLRVTHLGWHNLPAQVRRLDPETTSYREDRTTERTATGTGSSYGWREDAGLIRIDSPNDGLLVAGARAIRALGMLELAALHAASGVPPQDYFTPADGIDPADDAAVQAVLDAWTAARQNRTTAYVPAALNYHVNGWTPEQIQLNGAREIAITEVARLTGVDPEDLGVSTTSRTYQNSQDRRRAFLDFTVGPYMRAVEAALSMDTVTPHGYTVRFDTADFVRADDLTTAQTDQILIDSGVTTPEAVAARRGIDPRQARTTTTRAPQESPRGA